MKWLRRKPSLRVHGIVVIVCVGILLAVGVLISLSPIGDGSTCGQWLSERIFGSSSRLSSRQWSTCYVVIIDEKLRVVDEATVVTEEFMNVHDDNLFLYIRNSDPSGLLAPLHVRTQHGLIRLTNLNGNYPHRIPSFGQAWGLGFKPDDDGYLAADPRLVHVHSYAEDRVPRGGYAINIVALLACCGLVWSIGWTPRQIRHLIRRRRYIRGLCPLCRYDVHATPGRCPECGWGHEDEADEA